jgi:hypothetical protein
MSLLLIRMIEYRCTGSYPAISFLIQFLTIRKICVWSSIVVLNLIRRYPFWFDFFLTDEMANLRICQIQWWICESSPCHTSSVWPWSDAPKVLSYGTKVLLYGTYLDGLRHTVLWRIKSDKDRTLLLGLSFLNGHTSWLHDWIHSYIHTILDK